MRKALGWLCWALTLVAAAAEPATPIEFKVRPPRPGEPPREIYAHYMGCYPLSTEISSVANAQRDLSKVRADSTKFIEAFGSPWRNTPLLPPGYRVDPVTAAELEIRRALRAGLAGFAFDVLPGREQSLKTIAAFFEAARRGNYPIKFTFALDNPWRNPAVIAWLLENYGDSPYLARRHGKVLFFGYHSFTDAREFVREYLERKRGNTAVPQVYVRETSIPGLPQLERDRLEFPELTSLDDLRLTPAGWAAHGKVYRFYEQKFKQPFYIVYDQNLGPTPGDFRQREDYYRAVRTLARDFDAVGRFFTNDGDDPEVTAETARLVRAAGKEWWEPLFYQYENSHWQKTRLTPGASTLRERWRRIFENDSTLIQFATWNDYTENTNLAPSREYHYAYFDLNRYLTDWWKTGVRPELTKDRLYVFYNLYPRKADIQPFRRSQLNDFDSVIEVVTLAVAPGEVSLPGRQVVRSVPAGLSYFQIPATPGPVKVELRRDGRTVAELTAPEPVTDRPFRQQLVNAAFSTEFARHWREDFGDAAPEPLQGFYGDVDGDGMPNWFEMYYFGKLGDFATAAVAEPGADANGDGISNLESYRRGLDPVRKVEPYTAGTCWDILADVPEDCSFNPEVDQRGNPVWYYSLRLRKAGATGDYLETPVENSYRKLAEHHVRHSLTYQSAAGRTYRGGWMLQRWPKGGARSLDFNSGVNSEAQLEFHAPVGGVFSLSGRVIGGKPAARLELRDPTGKVLLQIAPKPDEARDFQLDGVRLNRGDRLSFVAVAPDARNFGQFKFEHLQVKLKQPQE